MKLQRGSEPFEIQFGSGSGFWAKGSGSGFWAKLIMFYVNQNKIDRLVRGIGWGCGGKRHFYINISGFIWTWTYTDKIWNVHQTKRQNC